jgi:hypothetical protein
MKILLIRLIDNNIKLFARRGGQNNVTLDLNKSSIDSAKGLKPMAVSTIINTLQPSA